MKKNPGKQPVLIETGPRNPAMSVFAWHDERGDDQFFVREKIGLVPDALTVRHAGSSIWRKGTKISRKKSDSFGIELVAAGNLRFYQDGKEYLIEPGEIFIKRRGGNHYYETGPAGFVHKRFIRLDGPAIESVAGNLGIEKCDVYRLSNPARFVALQKNAVLLIKHPPSECETRLALLAFEILLLVAHDHAGSLHPPEVSVVIELMRENMDRTLSIDEMSRKAGISATQLFRLFRQDIGKTPGAYFIGVKIKRAAELLEHTSTPIKQIAFSLGYNDPAYFANQFRRLQGVSPREYRKRSSA